MGSESFRGRVWVGSSVDRLSSSPLKGPSEHGCTRLEAYELGPAVFLFVLIS